MVSRVIAGLSVAVTALLTAGCGTIYVSNVAFKAVEVCSEELASRLHANTGCLPPTRAENAQGLYLARYRLQLSPAEADTLVSENFANGDVNHVPSWIGRVFRARPSTSDAAGKTEAWGASIDGNLEFIPLGGSLEKKIATELQVKTDISGIVNQKLAAEVEANPVALLDRAFKAAGLAGGAIPPGLKAALAETVLGAGYEKSSLDVGKGTYYYVSMKPEQLDALTSGLARCGWRINQAPGSQTIGLRSSAPVSATTGDMRCLGAKGSDGPIEPNVRNLLLKIHEATEFRPDIEALGIVIGAAVIRTEGRSELCSAAQLGLRAAGTTPTATMTCESLKTVLNSYTATGSMTGKIPEGTPAKPAEAITPEQAKSLLLSLSFEYARATYKTMQLYPHTSVLALHWVPLSLLVPPAPKPKP